MKDKQIKWMVYGLSEKVKNRFMALVKIKGVSVVDTLQRMMEKWIEEHKNEF